MPSSCCSYSGIGAYSLAASLATAPPPLLSLSLSTNASSGWSGLYSASLSQPPGVAQLQLQLTISDGQGLGNQVRVAQMCSIVQCAA